MSLTWPAAGTNGNKMLIRPLRILSRDTRNCITVVHKNNCYTNFNANVYKILKILSVRHVTGWDKDYLRKIPRVVW